MTNDKDVKKCTYIRNNGRPCMKPLYDSERCIFHSHDMERKRGAFDEAFWEEFDRQKRENKGFDFGGYSFPGSIGFSDKKLVGNVCFAHTIFSGKADFNSTIFEGDADFSNARFYTDAFFRFAAFEKKAVFNAASFSGKTAFTKANFKRAAEFNLSEFRGDTDFNGAEFYGKVNFKDAVFAWDADFSKVNSKNDVNFETVTFSGATKFINANFSGIILFTNANFLNDAYFRNTKFENHLSLDCARVSGIFDFSDTESNGTDFSNTTFFRRADFCKGKFYGETIDFRCTKFEGESVNFQGAEFKGHFVNLDGAQFSGEEARFTGCDFGIDKVSLSGAYFNNVIGLFESLEKEKNYLFFLKRYRYLFDDFSFRLGSESAGRYPKISGGIQEYWHYENLKKKYPLFYWFLRVSTDLNKSISRFLLFCIFIIIFFAVIYYGCFYCSDPSLFEAKYIESSCPFISFVYFSAVTFTTLGFGDITPRDGILQMVITIEVILGYMMLGLLINLIASFLYSRKS